IGDEFPLVLSRSTWIQGPYASGAEVLSDERDGIGTSRQVAHGLAVWGKIRRPALHYTVDSNNRPAGRHLHNCDRTSNNARFATLEFKCNERAIRAHRWCRRFRNSSKTLQ